MAPVICRVRLGVYSLLTHLKELPEGSPKWNHNQNNVLDQRHPFVEVVP